ncbi:MAG: MFS transporter [Paracoccaceae bacterium]
MAARFLIENARWLGAGFAFSFLSSFGQTFFISLFAGEIKDAYGLSDGEWGTLYTVATLASAAALLRFGGLADGLRLDRLTVALLAAYAAIAAGMALSSSVILLGILVAGLRFCGQGMMSHLAITAMGRWFRAHRGRAVTIAGLGFSVGEALLPATAIAAAGFLGWRGAWGAVALLLALGAIPLMTLLLARGRTPRGTAGEADTVPGLDGRHWTRAEVARHWAFWALLPALLSAPFIGTVLFFHQVHIAETRGWALEAMAAGYPLYAGLTIGTSLLSGWAADRLGPARLLPPYLLPLGAGLALLSLGSTGVEAWFAALALAGITQGMAHAIWGALWPELYGTRHLGAIRSISISIMVVATALGPGATGLVIDAGADFTAQAPWMALWCAGVAAMLLGVTARLAPALKTVRG